MRTVIVLAVGIFLGRQLYLHCDSVKARQKEEAFKKKLTEVLQANGISKDDVEKHIQEALQAVQTVN